MVTGGSFLDQTKTTGWQQIKKRLFSAELIFIKLLLLIFFSFLYLAYLSRIDVVRRIEEYATIIFTTRDLWANPIPSLLDPELWRGANFQEIFETALFHLPYLVYFFSLFQVGLRRLRGRAESTDALIAVTALMGIFSYGLIIFRAGFDALFRIMIPFYILAGHYLWRLDGWSEGLINNLYGARRGLKRLFTLKKDLILLLFPALFIFDAGWLNGYYVGSVGAVRENSIHLKIARADLFVPEYEYKCVMGVTQFIKDHSRKGDLVFAVPFNPIWYFLTDRKNPSYYEWILPGVLREKEAQEKVVRELKVRPPKFIIYADVAIDGREARRFSNYAPVIENYIRSNYEVKKRVGFYKIFGRKGERDDTIR